MEQHLRSEYHAAAAGCRLYAFVNAMHAAGICCKKQRCEENIYQFRFYAKHRKAVEQLAQTYHVQLTLTPRKTLQQFLHQYRFRFGIPLGILFSAAQSYPEFKPVHQTHLSTDQTPHSDAHNSSLSLSQTHS